MATKIVSEHQRGFIAGRIVSECIGITLEEMNLLDKKSFVGKMAMKIDIKKAFDNFKGSYLLRVLKNFCFNLKFCS